MHAATEVLRPKAAPPQFCAWGLRIAWLPVSSVKVKLETNDHEANCDTARGLKSVLVLFLLEERFARSFPGPLGFGHRQLYFHAPLSFHNNSINHFENPSTITLTGSQTAYWDTSRQPEELMNAINQVRNHERHLPLTNRG